MHSMSCFQLIPISLNFFLSDDSFLSNNSSNTLDHDALQQRVMELEKKMTEQADEIVCLRSTLADVLRRVNQLEGRGDFKF